MVDDGDDGSTSSEPRRRTVDVIPNRLEGGRRVLEAGLTALSIEQRRLVLRVWKAAFALALTLLLLYFIGSYQYGLEFFDF